MRCAGRNCVSSECELTGAQDPPADGPGNLRLSLAIRTFVWWGYALPLAPLQHTETQQEGVGSRGSHDLI